MILNQITRRGKYLLFHVSKNINQDSVLLWHLGISGSLRLSMKKKFLKPHDYIQIAIGSYYLMYDDLNV
ncbi:hypothetical protein B1F79_02060 [Coxiella-like endosymbiont of Rhipicephalus sanguineus]|uniref:DNA-formamidopyrimidine glycosylase family protein n=1 Tax=Coxiella-like endosymbiont of Rhipicephalus sanguineus TaxID=1955402 RepID=UPI0035582E23|nr:hypothetical protein [Coxiella-like endosymbiont of Rhipicephalus sanguineus]